MCPEGRSHKALNQVTWRAKGTKRGILTNTTNPEMRKCVIQVSTNVNVPMRGCSILLEEKIPRIISQLRKQPQRRIHVVLMTIDRTTLQNVWNEFDYRLGLCHVTQGVKMGHL
ncbi:hypothetical protein AVEN_273664-1 [Araneus ventricosus]|uniref:Uncharacterized protein n=1 Tax=Araneus ventricosus TaxID=182803 RepID=A0A4Y2J794_ARAVE|nr:hypothetical protein AVEN_273664-1 [Araneus ventricosus]